MGFEFLNDVTAYLYHFNWTPSLFQLLLIAALMPLFAIVAAEFIAMILKVVALAILMSLNILKKRGLS